MLSFEVRIEGIRPLLQHNPSALVKTKTRGSGVPEPEQEAENGLYRTTEGVIYQPAQHILSAMRRVGADFKVAGKGRVTYQRYIYAGIGIQPFQIPLLSRTNGKAPTYEVDLQPAVIQRARIMRARPRFDDWALEFKLEILDPIIPPEIAQKILEDAGKYQGLADFRPLFGLFSVASWRLA